MIDSAFISFALQSKYDDDLYHDDDIITMEDHGLWAPYLTGPVYLFNYSFREFQGTREEANARTGNVYTLPSDQHVWNYGIAHTGPLDESNELLPVRVSTNVNYEDPQIKNRSEQRPQAMLLVLNVEVSGLNVGTDYVMYKYDDEKKIPSSNFSDHVSDAVKTFEFTATSGTFVVQENIMSDQKAIYRAVKKV